MGLSLNGGCPQIGLRETPSRPPETGTLQKRQTQMPLLKNTFNGIHAPRYETSIAHFCEPADLLSVHLRDTGEPVVAAAGQVFFYQRKVGEWLTYEGAKTPISREGDLLLASLPGMEEFRHVFEDFASSADADPQQFRGWCARKTDLKSLVELPSLSPSLADVRDELAGDYAYLQQL
ncbi:unnamed protein product [Effrenium voratum]|uniref:Uncharacterized protein n=1 Tax=Effrenium voratum TaxID=2562239 RepID=A0AA36JIY9_9DINO|nr:unnamed protein product [Effrenium voratum]CAJ1417513.1 unnamed protein product [Effrenium voratum]